MRGSKPSPSSVAFLYQLMVGGGIPVAVHSNRATSVSFTVRVKPSVGEVITGETAQTICIMKISMLYDNIYTPWIINVDHSSQSSTTLVAWHM